MKTLFILITLLILPSISSGGVWYSLENSDCEISFGDLIVEGLGIASLVCKTLDGAKDVTTTEYLLYRFDGASLSIFRGEDEKYFLVLAADGSFRFVDPNQPILLPLVVVEGGADEDL